MSLIGGGSDDSGPPTRKTHIFRIYKDNDPDSGIWIDIERIDELTYSSGAGFAQQEKVWTFNWADFNPDGDGVTKKKIKDPNDTSSSGNGSSDDSGSADSSASVVLVPVRDKIEVSQGSNNQFQEYIHFFSNDSGNTSRKTHSRRVYHYDVPDDQLDENKNPPRNPQDYLNALGDKDASQYLEVEILDSFTTSENENRDSHGQIKPSVSQDKVWLVNNDSALLSDRDGDTSNDFATNNPADGIVDPPWRLDPLQNIVNVGFGDPYKLVVLLQGLRGDPQSVIEFTTPKTFFSGGDLIKGNTPVPVFGDEIDVPTGTISRNGSYSIELVIGGTPTGLFFTISYSGDQLLVAEPDIYMDYRGYITLQPFEWFITFNEVGAPNWGLQATKDLRYFNYKGEEVSKIPPLSKTAITKGLPIASDKNGIVYVKSYLTLSYPNPPELSNKAGLTKYDNNSNMLWTSHIHPDDPNPTIDMPASANYDPETGLITLVILDTNAVDTWDLDGINTSHTALPSGYTMFAASRKGRIYAINNITNGLAAFSSANGNLNNLWEISSDFQFAEVAAFGEDYVIVVEISTTDQVSTWYYSVYDANNGNRVGREFWAINEESSFGLFSNVEFDQSSYSSLRPIPSAYFP